MKLRSQIFLLLFLLGLAPLLVAVAINVPIVLDKLELFYHEAYLEKLRAGFRNLDQHITRRQEMVRLFAKLPEPGIALAADGSQPDDTILKTREAYTRWANQVLFDQLDIIQVIFINRQGEVSFALDRNQATGLLEQDHDNADLPAADFFAAGVKAPPGAVLTSPISFNRKLSATEPNRFMIMRFISPLVSASAEGGAPELNGVVVFNLDIGGLAHAYRGIYWVQNDGEYLPSGNGEAPSSNAFRDFPGLEKIFAKGELGLWEYGGQQIFWLPLFPTRNGGPLWVGRSVDPSPIAEFNRALGIRVAIIVTGLLLVVLVVARVIAVRTERISLELTDGIREVLEQDKPVEFSWQRPEELRVLASNLTKLAKKHAQDTSALRSHARELEESNRYKSEFLANISHELRTPLNSILLLSRMLASAEDRLSPQDIQQARVIHNAGKDLRALIDSILDLSRIEAGKAALKAESVQLATLLGEVHELMSPQFREKGLQLDLRIDADAPSSIITDEEKLRQILINFLSNALKFTERGSVALRLSRNTGDDAEACPLAISVTDSGIGIPADKQALVFEAFKQADGSTSRRYGGTGLGLTISRELAGLIGGRIEVRSEEGRGSTFTLLLPLRLADKAEAEQDDTSAAVAGKDDDSDEPGLPDAQYPGSRILVVDDDLRNLLALTPLLERWGIEVVAAGDGDEALETLHEDRRFDLILMDLMMPEMDGFETMEKIRADASLASVPIVALTARAGAEDRDRAVAAGADGFLAKPLEAAELKQVLDSHLGTEKQQTVSAATRVPA